jgi:hypothetical protein
MFKTIIDIIKDHKLSFRKAAAAINSQMFSIVIVKLISSFNNSELIYKREKFVEYSNSGSGENAGRKSIERGILATKRNSGVRREVPVVRLINMIAYCLSKA